MDKEYKAFFEEEFDCDESQLDVIECLLRRLHKRMDNMEERINMLDMATLLHKAERLIFSTKENALRIDELVKEIKEFMEDSNPYCNN